jgi:hypothetical protein
MQVDATEDKKRFVQNHQAWLDEQNTRFEKTGLWCDTLPVW